MTLLGIIVPSYAEILRWVAAESIALVISGFMLTGLQIRTYFSSFILSLNLSEHLNPTTLLDPNIKSSPV